MGSKIHTTQSKDIKVEVPLESRLTNVGTQGLQYPLNPNDRDRRTAVVEETGQYAPELKEESAEKSELRIGKGIDRSRKNWTRGASGRIRIRIQQKKGNCAGKLEQKQ
jgi:hypothetical protein